jgi:hypothetical protein
MEGSQDYSLFQSSWKEQLVYENQMARLYFPVQWDILGTIGLEVKNPASFHDLIFLAQLC